jgi:hypothetical protein
MKPKDLNPVRDVLKSIHKGVKRKSKEWFGPFKYSLNGKDFSCSHCGNELFYKNKGQTNTRLSTFMGLDFLDEQMTILICSECGLLFWMNSKPHKRDNQ